MRIIGFKLLKILAERFKDTSGSIQVSTNFSIPHFEKESFKDSSGKETAFDFFIKGCINLARELNLSELLIL